MKSLLLTKKFIPHCVFETNERVPLSLYSDKLFHALSTCRGSKGSSTFGLAIKSRGKLN